MSAPIFTLATTVLKDIKVQAAASTYTLASGFGFVFDDLSSILRIACTVSGLALTWMIICNKRLEMKRIKLGIEIDKQELKED